MEMEVRKVTGARNGVDMRCRRWLGKPFRVKSALGWSGSGNER